MARPAALAVSVLLAALLNAGALGTAVGWATPAVPASAGPLAPPLRARVVVLAPAPPPAAPRGLAAQAPQPEPAPPPEPPAAAEPAVRAPALAAAEPPLSAEPSPDAEPQQLRLYGFDEVDVAAAPESEWAIDVDTLGAAGLTRLVFEVIVDERGSVLACTVLDPTGLDDLVRSDLERRLAATPLRPAERGGRFVASVRRIEMRVETID